MCTQKMRALSYIGAEKITFPPKPDKQTYRHTYRRTDNSVYRVASLLKIYFLVQDSKEMAISKGFKNIWLFGFRDVMGSNLGPRTLPNLKCYRWFLLLLCQMCKISYRMANWLAHAQLGIPETGRTLKFCFGIVK